MNATISEVLAEAMQQLEETKPLALMIPQIGVVYGGFSILLGLAIRRGIVSDTAILEATSREYGRSGAEMVSERLEKCIEIAKKFDIQEENAK